VAKNARWEKCAWLVGINGMHVDLVLTRGGGLGGPGGHGEGGSSEGGGTSHASEEESLGQQLLLVNLTTFLQCKNLSTAWVGAEQETAAQRKPSPKIEKDKRPRSERKRMGSLARRAAVLPILLCTCIEAFSPSALLGRGLRSASNAHSISLRYCP
jgi:hypothetical protein